MSVVQGLLSAQHVRWASSLLMRVQLQAVGFVILMLLRVHVLLIMRECARQAMKDLPVATGLMLLLVTPVMRAHIRLVPETVDSRVPPLCASPAALASSALAQATQSKGAALQERTTPRALRTLPARLVPQAPCAPPPVQSLHSVTRATMAMVEHL